MKSRGLKRVSRKWQFERLFRKGEYFRGKALKVRFMRNSLGCIRLGFSVSAKKGNAVRRNLFRRRLRQYSVQKEVEQGFDAVIMPVDHLRGIRWEDMLEDMERLCGKVEAHSRKS